MAGPELGDQEVQADLVAVTALPSKSHFSVGWWSKRSQPDPASKAFCRCPSGWTPPRRVVGTLKAPKMSLRPATLVPTRFAKAKRETFTAKLE